MSPSPDASLASDTVYQNELWSIREAFEGTSRVRIEGHDVALALYDGAIHLAYSLKNADALMHTWATSNGFATGVIDDRSPRWVVSWTIGSTGPDLVFANPAYNTIPYWAATHQSTGDWQLEAAPDGPEGGMPSAVWHQGERHVAYLSRESIGAGSDTTTQLEAAWRHRPVLDGQLSPHVGPGTETYLTVHDETALGVDSNGVFHMVYTAPVDDWREYPAVAELAVPFTVRYVTVTTEGQWSTPQRISKAAGYYAGLSLVVDGEDTVHIAFVEETALGKPGDPTEPETNRLQYYRRAAQSAADWTPSEPLGSERVRAWRNSMTLDGNGRPHLAYCILEERTCRGVAIAVDWSTEVIADGCNGLGEYATPAVDSDGTVHVAYQGCDNAQLILASKSAVR